jgi:hypothetical protein
LPSTSERSVKTWVPTPPGSPTRGLLLYLSRVEPAADQGKER